MYYFHIYSHAVRTVFPRICGNLNPACRDFFAHRLLAVRIVMVGVIAKLARRHARRVVADIAAGFDFCRELAIFLIMLLGIR